MARKRLDDALDFLQEFYCLVGIPPLLVNQAQLVHGEGHQVVIILDLLFTVKSKERALQ